MQLINLYNKNLKKNFCYIYFKMFKQFNKFNYFYKKKHLNFFYIYSANNLKLFKI